MRTGEFGPSWGEIWLFCSFLAYLELFWDIMLPMVPPIFLSAVATSIIDIATAALTAVIFVSTILVISMSALGVKDPRDKHP